jgi:hypothetical protein
MQCSVTPNWSIYVKETNVETWEYLAVDRKSLESNSIELFEVSGSYIVWYFMTLTPTPYLEPRLKKG